MELSENGQNLAEDRYFWNKRGEKTWNQLAERLSVEDAKNEQADTDYWQKEFYSIIEPMDFIPAGRILRNLGRPKPSTGNCNFLPLEDSIESIAETLKNYLIISAHGGGNGINFSALRPKDAPLKTKEGEASGLVSFIEIFDAAGKVIKTGGQRRAAGMALCSISHPEVKDFINAKVKHDKLNQFNISVIITEEFLQAVENDEDWDLKFAGKTYETVKAKELWDMILTNMLKHSEPGLINWDNITKNNSYSFAKIAGVNPCQPGWAPFLTPQGIAQLKDVDIGSTIWSEDGWVTVTNKVYSGVKDVYKYRTNAGVVYSTKEHKVVDRGNKVEVQSAETVDILRGPKNSSAYIPEVVMGGLVLGDGSVHKASNNLVHLFIGENDQDYFDSEISHLIIKYRPGLGETAHEIDTDIKHYELPKTYNRSVPDRYKYGNAFIVTSFLRGLYSANGSVLERAGRVQFASSSKRIVEDVQIMLSSIGIKSYTTHNKGHRTKFPNGIYTPKESWDINITTDTAIFADKIGFLQKYKNERLERVCIRKGDNNHNDKISFDITETEYVSTEDVYDITVDGEHHTYWSGGCNVSNCSEIALEDWGVCLLGSLVLPHFIINKNTDWKKLSRTIKLAVRFLDNVIDLAYYPIPIQEIVAKNARRIGLGTMGLSDFLFMKEIRYGSEKAIAEVEKLYRFIRDETYMASMELAKEKGTFPKYNKKDFNNASFVKKLPAKIRILIKENGIRNTTMLTAPPTGSSSLLVDVVGGIEPLPFKGFRRVDGLGERIYVHPLCKEHYDEEWFVDSYDLTPTEHLEMQSVVNRYVDSGVSKTILLPESATVDELSKLLLEYIRDLKGVAVYRDKSRDLQVYYRMERDAIEKYLLENGETALTDEDMQCKTGTCDI